MRRIVLAALLAVTALPAFADENTSAASSFIVTCGQRLPETKKTVQILKDEGWRYESTDGSYHFYSQNGRRVIAATSVTSSPDQACLSSVNKLGKSGAVAIAKAAAKSLGLAEVKEQLPDDVYGVWAGRLNGNVVYLLAMPPEDFGFIRGASVVLMLE